MEEEHKNTQQDSVPAAEEIKESVEETAKTAEEISEKPDQAAEAADIPGTAAAVTDKKKSVGRELFEWFYTIVIAVAIAFGIKGFLFDIVKVDGDSMLPTLHNRERLIITKIGYTPEQGDIVILDSNYAAREEYFARLAEQGSAPGTFAKLKTRFFGDAQHKEIYYVKRVVALPGQTVDIRDGKLYVDGSVYEDGYHQGSTQILDPSMKYPHTVSEGCAFVLGDNREHSKDSRIIGDIPYKAIIGKANFRIWPLNMIGSVY